MEPDLLTKDELEDVPVEEEWAELVLEQTQAHQPAHVAEGVQTLGTAFARDRGVKAALARAKNKEERKRMINKFNLQCLEQIIFGTLYPVKLYTVLESQKV